MTHSELKQMADRMRVEAIHLAYHTGKNGAHLGGGLSAVEILAVLYGNVMRYDCQNPAWPDRDRFILSKGHGTLAYYTALQEAGFFTREKLYTFEENGGELSGQPSRNLDLGIEVSSGSLGMGLSVGAGMALAAKMQHRSSKVYVLLGDGECNEGSIWEAVMSASHFRLDNLIAVVDYNGMQSDGFCKEVFSVGDPERIWSSFGWETAWADGHDVSAILTAIHGRRGDSPFVLLAKTIKGKGVSFLENNKNWHHGALSEEQYHKALQELAQEG